MSRSASWVFAAAFSRAALSGVLSNAAFLDASTRSSVSSRAFIACWARPFSHSSADRRPSIWLSLSSASSPDQGLGFGIGSRVRRQECFRLEFECLAPLLLPRGFGGTLLGAEQLFPHRSELLPNQGEG